MPKLTKRANRYVQTGCQYPRYRKALPLKYLQNKLHFESVNDEKRTK